MGNINTNVYTEKEDGILKQYYPTEGSKIVKKLPGRMIKECPEDRQSS